MDWYCALVEHLLDKDNIKSANQSFEGILQQLESRVISLYKALLLYQMKSICSYYRNQGLVFLRGLLSLDNWNDDLKNVTDMETAVRNDANQYVEEHTRAILGTVANHAKGMEKLLQDLLQDIRDFISTQKDLRRDDMETACRRDLRVVDPQHDMERIEKSKDELLDDAYKWILDTPQYSAFTNWDDIPQCRRLLWVKGPAGTGKTMLMIGIIRELSRQPVVLAPGLSFFFCQGTSTALNNATSILRSLIWLLLVQQPDLMSHLRQKYNESGIRLFEDQNAFFALSEVFRNMLKDRALSPMYFVVDALDECEQGLPDLLQLISESLDLSKKVRWLVSSRPNVEVKNPKTTETLLELDAQSLERPVQAYIDHKLSILEGKDGYDGNTMAAVSDMIYKRASNTFLWVALVFKELESVDGWDAVGIIEEIPDGLSKLYGRMMTQNRARQQTQPATLYEHPGNYFTRISPTLSCRACQTY